jgi:hypothetical protein
MLVHYINTDLDIESKQDLTRVVEEFGDDVIVLYHGEARGYQRASFEIAGNIDGADEVINYFCTLVESLPKDAREIWDNCVLRTLDIGYESGAEPRNFRSELRPGTIKRVADIGAGIIITIYPVGAYNKPELQE